MNWITCSTYKTNKNYQSLWVFVGLNNHRQTIVFRAILLCGETIHSLRWLFETFLKSMDEEKSKTIVTYQNVVMGKAILWIEHLTCMTKCSKACESIYYLLCQSHPKNYHHFSSFPMFVTNQQKIHKQDFTCSFYF